MLLNALFKLAFAVAPDINSLTSQHKLTRRLILQQARYHPINRALTDCKLTVLGSISLSFSLFFRLSITVLVHYRSLTSI